MDYKVFDKMMDLPLSKDMGWYIELRDKFLSNELIFLHNKGKNGVNIISFAKERIDDNNNLILYINEYYLYNEFYPEILNDMYIHNRKFQDVYTKYIQPVPSEAWSPEYFKENILKSNKYLDNYDL